MMWRVLLAALCLLPVASAQFQPVAPDLDGLEVREDLAAAGDMAKAERVLRFVQVSDAHIIDDDATLLRVEFLDPLGPPVEAAQRPQEEYTDEVLNRAIAAINAEHDRDRLDFVINTGDNIDNSLENELMRFIDNWDGTLTTVGPISASVCVPDGESAGVDDASQDVADACTHLPDAVAQNNVALTDGLPWFSAFGNHDGLAQGNAPILPGFQEAAATGGRLFIDQASFVAMHFRAGTQCLEGNPMGDVLDDYGHGFGWARTRLCDDDSDNDGYYAFDLAGVRFVVLDTLNDDFVTGNEHLASTIPAPEGVGRDLIGGYAEGAVDAAQFAWLEAELAANQDRLIVLMSHHTAHSMFTDPAADVCCGPGGESLEDLLTAAGYRTGDDILSLLDQHPNVAAWIGGHTHRHRIQALDGGPGDSPGFWSIESSSLVDLPQEMRVLELWTTGDKGFLTSRLISHDFQLSKDLAAGDPQGNPDSAGTATDQEVLLWFDVPSQVRLSPQPRLPQYLVLDATGPVAINGTHGSVGQPVELSIEVTDSILGAPVPGLNVSFFVQHADPEDYKDRITDVDADVSSTSGTYSIQFTPVHGATHYVSIQAIDPSGTYEPGGLSAALTIVDPDAPLPKAKQEESPGIGIWIGVAVLALAAARRR